MQRVERVSVDTLRKRPPNEVDVASAKRRAIELSLKAPTGRKLTGLVCGVEGVDVEILDAAASLDVVQSGALTQRDTDDPVAVDRPTRPPRETILAILRSNVRQAMENSPSDAVETAWRVPAHSSIIAVIPAEPPGTTTRSVAPGYSRTGAGARW
jgi:hypothetical protein